MQDSGFLNVPDARLYYCRGLASLAKPPRKSVPSIVPPTTAAEWAQTPHTTAPGHMDDGRIGALTPPGVRVWRYGVCAHGSGNESSCPP